MILDVNVLLYAIDSSSPQHRPVQHWLGEALTGSRRIGFPWQTIGGFLRIATHPRVFDHPLSVDAAWTVLDGWLESPVAWLPEVSPRTITVLRELSQTAETTGALVSDAQLAALALEHAVPIVSTDADFDRFPGLTRIDPRR